MSSLRAMAFSLSICSLVAAACSSSKDDNGGIGGTHKCGQVAPCGGNIVGNWTIADSCFDQASIVDQDSLDEIKQDCPAFSYTADLDVSGTLAFTASTYSADFDATSKVIMHFPKSCLNGLSCALVESALQSYFEGSGVTFSCAGSSDCDCTLSTTSPVAETGTYTTASTTITMTADTGDVSSNAYCVSGSTLHFIQLDSTDMSKIAADIVATK